MFTSFHRNPTNFEWHLRPNGAKILAVDDMKAVISRAFISNSGRKVYEAELQNDCSTGQLCSSASRTDLTNDGAPAPVVPGTFEVK